MNRSDLANVYLDWKNNFLTLSAFAEHYGLYEKEAEQLIGLARSCFAEHYGLYEKEAEQLIELARSCFNKPHPDA